MEFGLELLTDDDRRILEERGKAREFDEEEVILEEGSTRASLYFILDGQVRVERAYLGQGILLATLGPGDSFGEISFLENVGASASVIAEEPTHVLVIERTDIQSLLQSVPGLAIRFYHSLAVMLSRRLRETSALIPSLMVEEIPQVNRFHGERTGHLKGTQLPPNVMAGVDEFKDAMVSAERAIIGGSLDPLETAEVVRAACENMKEGLRHNIERDQGLSDAIGDYVFRETFPYYMASASLNRFFAKPRGYAGDYHTINMIYDDEAAGDGRLGPLVDRWVLDLKACKAVRQRRQTMTSMIRQSTKFWDHAGPVPVTSLACGPAREVFDLLEDESLDVVVTGMDIDDEALEYVARQVRERDFGKRIRLAKENVVRLSLGRGKIEIPPQAMIYSIGLIDYLEDQLVVRLLDWAHDHLVEGGTVVLGNFNEGNPDKAFMDYVGEWLLIHRSIDKLKELFARSKFGGNPVEVDADETNIQLFARCTKV